MEESTRRQLMRDVWGWHADEGGEPGQIGMMSPQKAETRAISKQKVPSDRY